MVSQQTLPAKFSASRRSQQILLSRLKASATLPVETRVPPTWQQMQKQPANGYYGLRQCAPVCPKHLSTFRGRWANYLNTLAVPLDTMAEIIAILSQKGGVGKTTTILTWPPIWRAFKQRVLVIDLDPQGNATSGLGLSKADFQPTVRTMSLEHQPLHLVVQPAVFDGQIFCCLLANP